MVKALPPDLTDAAFKEELKAHGDKLVMVDFFATWCGPCKMIAPKLEELETDTFVVLKVDVDQNEEVAQNNKISAMPTFLFFRNGEKVGEVVGASIEKIKGVIAEQSQVKQ